MNEKIKTQKGFIPVLVIIIVAVLASAGVGVVLYKQKSHQPTVNIPETLEGNKETDLETDKETIIQQEELEIAKLEAEKSNQEAERIRQQLEEKQRKEERLMDYRLQLQLWCDDNYDKLKIQWENDLREHTSWAVEWLTKDWEDGCKKDIDAFFIDNIHYCSNGILYEHTRSSYVPGCIEYKMQQINP